MAGIDPADADRAGGTTAAGEALANWLLQRRKLLARLGAEVQTGFQAVGAFDGTGYLDSIERQEDLCRQVNVLDAKMPAVEANAAGLEQAASELRGMNAELKKLADVQRALVEHGSRSIRCFQRVWAMGSFGYDPPAR